MLVRGVVGDKDDEDERERGGCGGGRGISLCMEGGCGEGIGLSIWEAIWDGWIIGELWSI